MAAATATLGAPARTPSSYHRIRPPAPIPVGLLACQRDPLARDLATTAVSCRVSQSPTVPSNGREGKKKKAAPALTAPLIEVILHDTVIFPEGGGQPSDVGTLTSADGELWDVVEAKRHGGHAVHYVRLRPEQDVDNGLKVFAPGALVGVALGEAGYKRRLDHMCMHTSQHLLSAVLEHQLHVDTIAWSLTGAPAQEIAYVQEECNRLVFEGRAVHIEVEELDTAGAKVKSGPTVGIPDDYTGGVKRTVVIDGVDRNPCCGTHAPSLHNLQLYLLPHTEALARGGTAFAGSVRLYFLAGPRLLAHLGAAHTTLTAAAGVMNCGAPQVPERVQQVVDERRRATKRVEDLEAELAGPVAAELFERVAGGEEAQDDDGGNVLGFLSAVATSFAGKVAEAEGGATPFLLVLSSSPAAQSATSTTVVLVGPRWSGKFTGVWVENREGATAASILEGVQL
ncbi:alanyl-tRNA synthetase domain-containing protein [Epithele typhae]|uniref:alanyl-tRNA synthetase domain-containing protein n=1 Tax=Epithele typhae TaxID=378194 RepID=UPI0020079337|nr:alanyl-tRNA synthetase domain-containing protein [Epithele typhae]KAH9927210.1 alanyl-tRNA synthetase domain-containing protein [Epithele typhae]